MLQTCFAAHASCHLFLERNIPVDQTLERLSVHTTKMSYLHCVINGQACCNRTTYPVEKQNMTALGMVLNLSLANGGINK